MRYVRNIGVIVIGIISLFPSFCPAASLLVTWVANTDSDLAGYKVYYGTQSRTYGTVADVQKANSYQISNVQNGSTYYVTVASYDNSGNESIRSTEVNAYIPVSVPVTDTATPDRERGDQFRGSHNYDQCSDPHAEVQRCRRNRDRDEDQQ